MSLIQGRSQCHLNDGRLKCLQVLLIAIVSTTIIIVSFWLSRAIDRNSESIFDIARLGCHISITNTAKAWGFESQSCRSQKVLRHYSYRKAFARWQPHTSDNCTRGKQLQNSRSVDSCRNLLYKRLHFDDLHNTQKAFFFCGVKSISMRDLSVLICYVCLINHF